jgi:hypothetical protein
MENVEMMTFEEKVIVESPDKVGFFKRVFRFIKTRFETRKEKKREENERLKIMHNYRLIHYWSVDKPYYT